MVDEDSVDVFLLVLHIYVVIQTQIKLFCIEYSILMIMSLIAQTGCWNKSNVVHDAP